MLNGHGQYSSSVPEIFTVQFLSLGYSLQSIYLRSDEAAVAGIVILLLFGIHTVYHRCQSPTFAISRTSIKWALFRGF
jgi:hypothetical protein